MSGKIDAVDRDSELPISIMGRFALETSRSDLVDAPDWKVEFSADKRECLGSDCRKRLRHARADRRISSSSVNRRGQ